MAPGTERVRGAYRVVKTLYRLYSCHGYTGMKARLGWLSTETVHIDTHTSNFTKANYARSSCAQLPTPDFILKWLSLLNYVLLNQTFYYPYYLIADFFLRQQNFQNLPGFKIFLDSEFSMFRNMIINFPQTKILVK